MAVIVPSHPFHKMDHLYRCADPVRKFIIEIHGCGGPPQERGFRIRCTMNAMGVQSRDMIPITTERDVIGEHNVHSQRMQDEVRSALRELVCHEVDEWLRCAGEFVVDPHPSHPRR